MSASSVNVFEVSNQVDSSTEGELDIGEFALASLTVEGQCHSRFCFEPHNFTPAKESKTNRQTSSKIRKQDVKGAVVVSYYYAKQEEMILKISIIFHRYGFLEQIFIQYRSSRLLVYTSWCHNHITQKTQKISSLTTPVVKNPSSQHQPIWRKSLRKPRRPCSQFPAILHMVRSS